MKSRFLLLFTLLLTVLASSTTADVPDLSNRLPGKYKLTYRGTLLSLEATKRYHPDGRYESIGSAKVLGIEKKLVHRGTWKLKNGELIYLLTESSTPSQAPVGVPLRFKVIRHDGVTMHYRDEARDKNYSELRTGNSKDRRK